MPSHEGQPAVADQRVPHISEANPDPELDDLAPGDAGRRMAVERAQRFLELSPRRALAGGYRRGDVDQLLGRASRTIDQYARRINELQLKIDGLASRYAELEGRYQQADGRSPQEVAGDMLAVAQRAIEQVKEDARVEAARVVTAARSDAERMLGEAHRRAEVVLAEAEQQRAESEGLRRETQSAIEAARHEAQTLHEAVEREKEQLLSDALTEVERMRSSFVAEKATVEKAIADQRSEWERFVSEALARIEIIDPEKVRAELRREIARPTDVQFPTPAEPVPEPASTDVADDLRERLPTVAEPHLKLLSGQPPASPEPDGPAEDDESGEEAPWFLR